MTAQLCFDLTERTSLEVHAPELEAEPPDLASYDTIIVAFSGGKDSLACLLHLLSLGVPREKIELWHHEVDGREGSTLMDWPCTRAYCEAIAAAFQVRLYFSWKVGGFEREMLRDDTPTAPIAFETPDGVRYVGGHGPSNTRLKFPQLSPNLMVRWCSAYLKIDVCAAAIRNQKRFLNQRVLVVTGERAEESPGRAKYKTLEQHRTDQRDGRYHKRHVDAWRPVHAWSRQQVWEIIERYRVNPHPAYRLNWGRLSCAACIFGDEDQWASLRKANPAQFEQVAAHEARFKVTVKREKRVKKTGLRLTVLHTWADAGTPYEMAQADMDAAISTTWNEPIFLDNWTLPQGAYASSRGPT